MDDDDNSSGDMEESFSDLEMSGSGEEEIKNERSRNDERRRPPPQAVCVRVRPDRPVPPTGTTGHPTSRPDRPGSLTGSKPTNQPPVPSGRP